MLSLNRILIGFALASCVLFAGSVVASAGALAAMHTPGAGFRLLTSGPQVLGTAVTTCGQPGCRGA